MTLPNARLMLLVKETGTGGYFHLFLNNRNDFFAAQNHLLAEQCITAKLDSKDAFLEKEGLYRIILDGDQSAVAAFSQSAEVDGCAYLEIKELGAKEFESVGAMASAMTKAAKLFRTGNSQEV